jgi:hypothetical protein
MGTGNNYMALARGFAANGLNPAGLGMPETQGFTLAVFPIHASQSLDPLTFSDIFDYEGETIPRSVKENWVQSITAEGGQTGSGRAEISPFSLSFDHFGLQLSTIAFGRTDLSPDAAELLLFGNAGRTGDPADLDLRGSGVTGYAVTTLGISYGIPLSQRWVPGVEQGLAVGFTLKQSWGHALAFAEDTGTLFINGDPVAINMELPVIHPSSDGGNWSRGGGIGLDLGAAWERGPWAAGAAILNLFHTFEWDLGELTYRAGRAVFDGNENNSTFDAEPAGEAPPSVREKIEDLTFEPTLSLGGAYDAMEELTVTAEVRHRLGDGLDTGPKSHFGLGMQYLPSPIVPLRAGFAVITDGFQIGGGTGLILGPVHLGIGALYQTGDVGDGFSGTFGLSFGGG